MSERRGLGSPPLGEEARRYFERILEGIYSPKARLKTVSEYLTDTEGYLTTIASILEEKHPELADEVREIREQIRDIIEGIRSVEEKL